jgi:AraC family transcriptional regulator of adaptative response/methylated-DNA-[protein]-cysteine methyltransferase
VTAALYDAGELALRKSPPHLGMTSVSYAEGGKGAAIAYAIGASPLGRLLVEATVRGVSMVSLAYNDKTLERELASDNPVAAIRRDDGALGDRLDLI